MRWSYVPAAVTEFGQWIRLWCDSPKQDLNQYLLYLSSVLLLFNFLPPQFSSLLSFTSCLPLSPISICLSSIFFLSSYSCLTHLSASPPLPSKGLNCDRNSNNTSLLCTNWLSLTSHTRFLQTNLTSSTSDSFHKLQQCFEVSLKHCVITYFVY